MSQRSISSYQKYIWISAYAIVYGLYENNIVYHTVNLLQYLHTYGNWAIMWSLFGYLCFLLRTNLDELLYGVLWFSTLEDIVFWCSSWVRFQIYPFPVGNWYDKQLPLFRLFHLGKATVHQPYVPTFYYFSLTICGVYFLMKCCNYQNLARGWSLLCLPWFYVIIIGSIILPTNIAYTEASWIFIISVITIYCLMGVRYAYKHCMFKQPVHQMNDSHSILNDRIEESNSTLELNSLYATTTDVRSESRYRSESQQRNLLSET